MNKKESQLGFNEVTFTNDYVSGVVVSQDSELLRRHGLVPEGVELYEKQLFDDRAFDAVTKPVHYTKGQYEVINILKDKMTLEQYRGFLLGNVLKYSMRFQNKNGVQDLEKAQVYLTWLIESHKTEV